jgi:hypothetical protein
MTGQLERRKTRQLRAALAALLLGAALPSPNFKAQTAQGPPASDTNLPNVPEVKHLEFTHTFPISPLQGVAPPGCAVSQTMTVCRTDKQPAKSFEAQAHNSLGWAGCSEASACIHRHWVSRYRAGCGQGQPLPRLRIFRQLHAPPPLQQARNPAAELCAAPTEVSGKNRCEPREAAPRERVDAREARRQSVERYAT